MAKVIAIWGVVAIASAIVAGIVASVKRRDHSFWAAWSFLVPPMLLILLVIVLLIFGNRIPGIARSLGSGITEFKKGLKDDPDRLSARQDDEEEKRP